MRPTPTRHRLGSVVRLDDRITPAALAFTLNPAQSSLTLSGNIGGVPFAPQGPGALSPAYAGTLVADLDLAANTIGFTLTGSAAVATNTGNWQPAPGGAPGSAPANYGVQVPTFGVLFAIRDSTAGFATSTLLALSGTTATRTFPSTQTVVLLSGATDYNIGAAGFGRDNLAGANGPNSAAAGSFADVNDGTARLTAPVNATFTGAVAGQPISYTVSGTVVGTAPFPTADLNGPAAGADATTVFTAGGPAVPAAPNTEVRRAPVANLASATIVLTNRPNGNAESLAVNLTGTGLTSAGYDPATGRLVITGAAPLATYQAVLRSLTYNNTAAGATAGARTITVTVNDGTIDSLPHTATVNVSASAVPRVTGTQVDDGSAQRSRVASLTVTFSTAVTLPANPAQAFRVSRTGPDAPTGEVTLAVDLAGSTATQTVARLTFSGALAESGSLVDGHYTLTVLSSQVSAGGVALDGDGDGSPGGDYTLPLYRRYGDVTGDRRVDNADFFQLRSTFGRDVGQAGYLAFFDANGDGRIDNADFFQFRTRFGSSL